MNSVWLNASSHARRFFFFFGTSGSKMANAIIFVSCIVLFVGAAHCQDLEPRLRSLAEFALPLACEFTDICTFYFRAPLLPQAMRPRGNQIVFFFWTEMCRYFKSALFSRICFQTQTPEGLAGLSLEDGVERCFHNQPALLGLATQFISTATCRGQRIQSKLTADNSVCAVEKNAHINPTFPFF